MYIYIYEILLYTRYNSVKRKKRKKNCIANKTTKEPWTTKKKLYTLNLYTYIRTYVQIYELNLLFFCNKKKAITFKEH